MQIVLFFLDKVQPVTACRLLGAGGNLYFVAAFVFCVV